jgi:hypothetical protein
MEEVSEFLRLFNKDNLMLFLLFFLMIVVLLKLIKVHLDPTSKISLEDIILTDDKVDEKKLARFGAWVVSTWGFVYLVVNSELTEWYFIGYIGVWVTNAIFDRYMNEKKNT